MRRPVDPRVAVVAAACTYEVVAIATGRLPTITALSWRVRETWAGRAAIWGILGYLAWHLLVERDVVAEMLGHDPVES